MRTLIAFLVLVALDGCAHLPKRGCEVSVYEIPEQGIVCRSVQRCKNTPDETKCASVEQIRALLDDGTQVQ